MNQSKVLHIVIDARAYSWTGVGRYIKNVVLGLLAQSSGHRYTLLVSEEDYERASQYILSAAGSDAKSRVAFEIVEGSYYTWQEQVLFLQQLNAIKADVFHFSHFNVPLAFRKPYVVTIHDITRFIFPGQKRQSLIQQIAYEYIFTSAVRHAEKVICVSDTTRKELLALPFMPQDRKKYAVIYEGVEQSFCELPTQENRAKIRRLLGTNEQYLLFVGVWMNHKNIPRLLKAFALIRKQYPALKLVITGKPKAGYLDCVTMAQSLGVAPYVIFPGFVSHELLPALYAEAVCFVFPTLYEGFGLPPLEAASLGVPVITSNVSSIPEIMENAVVYVNPEDVDDIARGVINVLDDTSVREHLVHTGKQHAQAFTWHDTARKTLQAYEEIG